MTSQIASQALAARSDAGGEAVVGLVLRVRGIVQGVGFRPTVWRVARELGLMGEVLNDGAGVVIRIWGMPEQVSRFEAALRAQCPPLARIESIECAPLDKAPTEGVFRILASEAGAVSTGVAPDAATCPACLAEIRDPANRRYRYPFTNCTHCGPRLSILRAIPYDRASTSMAAFSMCPRCQAEYDDPADRRFHAEPNACADCGPRLWLESGGRILAPPPGLDVIELAAVHIRRGAIVGIKGIGGFHLACDAGNDAAVANLRRRKHRYHKPFALMARDVATIKIYAHVDISEQELLESPAAPIVVLARLPDAPALAAEIAPGQSGLGFVLPYTPLHHLLMAHLDRPIVLTSGNASDEPQCTGNEDARQRLAGIADCLLIHDREIVSRLDDSVAHVVCQVPLLLRRARGYAPEPIAMPPGLGSGPAVLALGAELKSTFCLLGGERAVLSQHIGDLEDAGTHDDFRAALSSYRRLFAFEPDVIAIDAHPDYLSGQWGRALAEGIGAEIAPVLHHHAHIAAVLVEHGVPVSAAPVLGLVFDGLGLGENGALWGGEFLHADYDGCRRLAAFASVPLIGGARAMREPWRNAFAHLHQAIGWRTVAGRHPDLAIVRHVAQHRPDVLAQMVAKGINSPPASSAGRFFDAVAATLDISMAQVSYEGQAASELESLATPVFATTRHGYPVGLAEGDPIRLTWEPLWSALLGDIGAGTAKAAIAAKVHRTVIAASVELAERLCAQHESTTVVLSGGVFQNRLLLEGIAETLRERGRTVLVPGRFPTNDGAIALGQAALARRRSMVQAQRSQAAGRIA